jgi:3-dehydroquinate synthase
LIDTYEIPAEAGRSCEVHIGSGVATPGSLLLPGVERAGILTQPSVTDLADNVALGIRDRGSAADLFVLPDGDSAKTLATVEKVFEWLNSLGFTRADQVIGVGGGAATDMAGFAAATYLRGIEVTYLPTTLLGAVDAAIGGKTGVNVGGKNLAGVFRHPARVIVDLDVLRRLPDSLLREGAAETVKAGFISDTSILLEYEQAGLAASLDLVVPAAIRVKVDTVKADFTEQGLRAILNYGHTIGHAIEIAGGISHGDAVAIGMVAAGRVSREMLGFDQAARQSEILSRIGLPTVAPPVDVERVLMLMNRDKKRDSGGIRMVLLEDFGRPVLRHVDDDLIAHGLDEIGVYQ